MYFVSAMADAKAMRPRVNGACHSRFLVLVEVAVMPVWLT